MCIYNRMFVLIRVASVYMRVWFVLYNKGGVCVCL